MKLLSDEEKTIIYEWLRPELKGHNWQWMVIWEYTEKILPPLDYNTLYEEVIPKLEREGAQYVSFRSDHPSQWRIYGRVVSLHCDPYAALARYLKALRGEPKQSEGTEAENEKKQLIEVRHCPACEENTVCIRVRPKGDEWWCVNCHHSWDAGRGLILSQKRYLLSDDED